MNRRRFLVSTSVPVSALAGCLSEDSGGYTFSLHATPIDAADSEVLDFDRMTMTSGQRTVLEAAIASETYVETPVTWDTLPGRNSITMEFRTLIRRIADYADEDLSIEPGVSFDAQIRFRRQEYDVLVEIE